MCLINQRLDREIVNVSLLEMAIHLEAYNDMDDLLILSIVVEDFLLTKISPWIRFDSIQWCIVHLLFRCRKLYEKLVLI